MSNKIEFPIGVELPLRGGGVAVLYEFFDGRWFGRMKPAQSLSCRPTHKWTEGGWHANGVFDLSKGECMYDILPPKRKAWVVWNKAGPVMRRTKEEAESYAFSLIANGPENPFIQEITEP